MNNKKVLILDLDGTLYHQYGVQLFMGCRLAIYYLFHFWKFKELLMIMDYRKIREKNIKGIVEKQYKIIGQKYHKTPKQVEELIQKWMFEKPLDILPIFKDKKLDEIINNFAGKVFIYSDYPTKDKLEALHTKYDKAYDSTNSNIMCLKPESKGLEYLINENKLNKKDILFVGDRDSKDGECSRRCQIDYVILPKFGRGKKYKKIKEYLQVN